MRHIRWISLVLGSSLALTNALAFAESSRSIEIKGLNPMQVNRLRHDFPSLEHGNANLTELDEVMRSLFQSGQFEDIRIIQADPNHYILQAKPVLKVQSITVNGAKLFSAQEISEALGLAQDETLNRSRVQEGVDNLKVRYNEAGYLGSQISIDFQNGSTGYAVVVTVDEGSISRISEFEFLSNNEELVEDLQKVAKSYLKKNFQQSLLNKLQDEINEMFIERRYLTTMLAVPELRYSPDHSTVAVTYRLESPSRYVLLFDGNKELSNADLYSELQLSAHMGSAVNIATDLSQKIDAAYRRHGYANANTQVEDTPFGSFVHRLTFHVNEGQKIAIARILFSGTFSRPERVYKSLLMENASRIVRQGFYSHEDLDKAVQNLQLELQKEGYLRAKVQFTRADIEGKTPKASVYLQLEEGPLTRISSIQFLGATLPAEELQKQLGLAKDEPLSLTKLDHSIESLKTYYANLGYLDMVLENEKEGLVQYAHGGTEAALVFQVKEGPLVRVGSIAIDGLNRTKEDVVKIELEFKPGDVLTPERIQNTQYRLQRTGLFGSIDIYTLESGTPLAERTVVVHVVEMDPGVFTSGVGINTEFKLTVHGFAGVAYNNLGGTARAVSLRGEVKKITDLDFFDHRITTGYLEPYLFNTRTKGRVNVTRERSIIARFQTSNGPYYENIPAIDSTKLETILEREFERYYKFSYTLYGIQYIQNMNLAGNKEVDLTTDIIGYTGPTLEIEHRDNAFVPRSGTFTRLSVEYADPRLGSSNTIQYVQSVGLFNFYVPFFDKKLIWANSIRGGIVQNLSTSPNRYIPISRKFFLGGQSTLRGYDPDSLPPLDNDFDPQQTLPVTDQTSFYLIKTQLNFPLIGDLEGEVFYDEGAVFISNYQPLGGVVPATGIPPFDRASVGIGLRYITPVGPANLEYGYKLNHQPGETLGRFDISIGTF